MTRLRLSGRQADLSHLMGGGVDSRAFQFDPGKLSQHQIIGTSQCRSRWLSTEAVTNSMRAGRE